MGGLEGNVVAPKAELSEKGKPRKITFLRIKGRESGCSESQKVTFPGPERPGRRRREERTPKYRFPGGGGELKLYLSAMLKRLQ